MSRRLADEFYPKTLLKMDFLHCASQSLYDSLVWGGACDKCLWFAEYRCSAYQCHQVGCF